MTKRFTLTALALTTFLFLPSARAAITNGGFENGFDTWNTYKTGWTNGISLWSATNEIKQATQAPEGQYFAHLYADVKVHEPFGASGSAYAYAEINKSFSARKGESLQLEVKRYVPLGSGLVALSEIHLTGPNYDEINQPSGSGTTGWGTVTFPAFAADGDYTLKIYCSVCGGTSGDYVVGSVDTYVDRVALVPEPSGIVLVFGGAMAFLGYAVSVRRSKNGGGTI